MNNLFVLDLAHTKSLFCTTLESYLIIKNNSIMDTPIVDTMGDVLTIRGIFKKLFNQFVIEFFNYLGPDVSVILSNVFYYQSKTIIVNELSNITLTRDQMGYIAGFNTDVIKPNLEEVVYSLLYNCTTFIIESLVRYHLYPYYGFQLVMLNSDIAALKIQRITT